MPSLHSELDIDCGYKFLGDILRKCLFNGSPPENLMIKSYLRERLLDPIRQVHRQRLYRQPPAAALFHVNARIMLQELVSSESESGRYCAGIAAVPDWQAQVRTGLRSSPIPLGGAVEDAPVGKPVEYAFSSVSLSHSWAAVIVCVIGFVS